MPSPRTEPGFSGELFDSLNIAACLYDPDDRLRAWNASWLRFFPEHDGVAAAGEPLDEQLRRVERARGAVNGDDHLARAVADARADAHDDQTPTLLSHHGRWLRGVSERRGDGSRLCLWAQVPAPRGPGQAPGDPLVLAQPADELQAARDQARSAERLYRLLAEHTGDVVAGLSADGRVHYMSPSVQGMLGFAPQDFIGHDLSHLVCAEDRPAFLQERRRLRDQGAHTGRFTVRARHRAGALVWVEVQVQALPPEADPGGLAFVCQVRDVSESKSSQHALSSAYAELAQAATHDPLTGLVNRRYFDELLQREWRRLQRERGTLAVLLVEADHSHQWRERHGPLVADACLRAIAGVVREHARRAGDIAARHDGDTFAVVLPHSDTQAAMALAERIRGSVEHGDVLPKGLPPVRLSVSIGVACATPGETAPDTATLLTAAQAGLVDAKGQGRNRVGWAGV